MLSVLQIKYFTSADYVKIVRYANGSSDSLSVYFTSTHTTKVHMSDHAAMGLIRLLYSPEGTVLEYTTLDGRTECKTVDNYKEYVQIVKSCFSFSTKIVFATKHTSVEYGTLFLEVIQLQRPDTWMKIVFRSVTDVQVSFVTQGVCVGLTYRNLKDLKEAIEGWTEDTEPVSCNLFASYKQTCRFIYSKVFIPELEPNTKSKRLIINNCISMLYQSLVDGMYM